MTTFPVHELRRQFPAFAANGDFIFFDNAAGAQVPARVVAAVNDHLVRRNVQRGGPYRQSQEVDAMIARSRASVAAFVNATGADEIAFGLNATAFIRAISLAIGETLQQRPRIILSQADHEANVATWLALERMGAEIVWWTVRNDGRLHLEDLEPLLDRRTRLVACTMASNATGGLVDVTGVAERAHHAGAELFVDAVHYAPHGPIDVQAIGCDFLVCSGYKIFAPHMGFAWCRRDVINALPMFREHFVPDVTPNKLEAGTFIFENVAGMDAAVGYVEDIGRMTAADAAQPDRLDTPTSRVAAIRRGMDAIVGYEKTLSVALLDAVADVPGLTVHGISDPARVHERVPTLSFTVAGRQSAPIAEGLAARGIGARHGHMYSPRLVDRLGAMSTGIVRASLLHYNTVDEIATFRQALTEILERP